MGSPNGVPVPCVAMQSRRDTAAAHIAMVMSAVWDGPWGAVRLLDLCRGRRQQVTCTSLGKGGVEFPLQGTCCIKVL